MDVLASFVGGWGHAEPLLPVARLARSYGHAVTFAGQTAVIPRLAALGFPTIDVGPATLATSRQPLLAVDREHERMVARDHFVGEFGAHRAEHLGRVIAAARPRLVVCDEMDAGAVIAAEAARVPCVTIGVLASGRLTSPDVVGPAWAGLRAARGLTADPRCERFGGAVRLTPAPSSFRDPDVVTPFPLHPVRPPILADVDAPPTDHRDVVYATLGTVFDLESGDLFARIASALSTLDRPCVMTIGDQVPADELPPVAPHVRIEAFVPQRDLLPTCAAVVCHGGTGTVIAALSLGVPLVLLPMGADQPDNADRCHELGVGIVLDAVTASAPDIAGAVDEVIADPRYADAARRLAAEATAQPPIEAVGELVTLLAP